MIAEVDNRILYRCHAVRLRQVQHSTPPWDMRNQYKGPPNQRSFSVELVHTVSRLAEMTASELCARRAQTLVDQQSHQRARQQIPTHPVGLTTIRNTGRRK